MANPNHLEIVHQNVEIWNQWRKRYPRIRPDLSQANLRGLSLQNADLHGVDLHHTDLYGANLSGANLRYANLFAAKLIEINLYKADLTKAICGDTIFAYTNLSETKGLELIQHQRSSEIGVYTLFSFQSGRLPDNFLRGCGVPENIIINFASLKGDYMDFYSCFISYSHSDKIFAQRLYDALQANGIRCWLDEKQIKPGHDIASEIDRGIKLWDKTILCCSKSAIEEKWWVQFEMKKALEKEAELTRSRSQHIRAIIPLDLDGHLLEKYSGEYKSELMSRSVASFKGWEHNNVIFESEVERVIAALRTDEGRETPPTPKL